MNNYVQQKKSVAVPTFEKPPENMIKQMSSEAVYKFNNVTIKKVLPKTVSDGLSEIVSTSVSSSQGDFHALTDKSSSLASQVSKSSSNNKLNQKKKSKRRYLMSLKNYDDISDEVIPEKRKRVFEKPCNGPKKAELTNDITYSSDMSKDIFTSSLELTPATTTAPEVLESPKSKNLLLPSGKAEKIFVCTLCQTMYDSAQALTSHKRSHLKCKFCKAKMKNLTTLTDHAETTCLVLEKNMPILRLTKIDTIPSIVQKYSMVSEECIIEKSEIQLTESSNEMKTESISEKCVLIKDEFKRSHADVPYVTNVCNQNAEVILLDDEEDIAEAKSVLEKKSSKITVNVPSEEVVCISDDEDTNQSAVDASKEAPLSNNSIFESVSVVRPIVNNVNSSLMPGIENSKSVIQMLYDKYFQVTTTDKNEDPYRPSACDIESTEEKIYFKNLFTDVQYWRIPIYFSHNKSLLAAYTARKPQSFKQNKATWSKWTPRGLSPIIPKSSSQRKSVIQMKSVISRPSDLPSSAQTVTVSSSQRNNLSTQTTVTCSMASSVQTVAVTSSQRDNLSTPTLVTYSVPAVQTVTLSSGQHNNHTIPAIVTYSMPTSAQTVTVGNSQHNNMTTPTLVTYSTGDNKLAYKVVNYCASPPSEKKMNGVLLSNTNTTSNTLALKQHRISKPNNLQSTIKTVIVNNGQQINLSAPTPTKKPDTPQSTSDATQEPKVSDKTSVPSNAVLPSETDTNNSNTTNALAVQPQTTITQPNILLTVPNTAKNATSNPQFIRLLITPPLQQNGNVQTASISNTSSGIKLVNISQLSGRP